MSEPQSLRMIELVPQGDALATQVEAASRRGFVVVPGLVPDGALELLNEAASTQLQVHHEPLEYEADIKYPGAPASRGAEGGATVRRLLDAYGRDERFAQCARASALKQWMERYFAEPVLLSRAHHNCLMSKHPRFGSLTGWHRDLRYWSFTQPSLMSVWLALGPESSENGGLWFVPGSHQLELGADRFDADKFLRAELGANRELIECAESPRLAAGDAVFFHCNTLHAAGQNSSARIKFSLVFTYHGCGNRPVAGTRSSSLPEVALESR